LLPICSHPFVCFCRFSLVVMVMKLPHVMLFVMLVDNVPKCLVTKMISHWEGESTNIIGGGCPKQTRVSTNVGGLEGTVSISRGRALLCSSVRAINSP
jgi:hypothetical protein